MVPLRLRGPEIISSQLVPIGSIVTIVNKEPKRARAYFIFSYPVQYIIQIDSINAPAGIPVVIGLCCGIEGKSTVLNPLIFKPLLVQPGRVGTFHLPTRYASSNPRKAQ